MGSVEDVVEDGIGACASADFVECRRRKPSIQSQELPEE